MNAVQSILNTRQKKTRNFQNLFITTFTYQKQKLRNLERSKVHKVFLV